MKDSRFLRRLSFLHGGLYGKIKLKVRWRKIAIWSRETGVEGQ